MSSSRRWYPEGRLCMACGGPLKRYQKETCSYVCRSVVLRGDRHPQWKFLASYDAVHKRLESLPKPDACTHCGRTDKRIEWALDWENADMVILQDERAYSIDIEEDYMAICSTCHRLLDDNPVHRERGARGVMQKMGVSYHSDGGFTLI